VQIKQTKPLHFANNVLLKRSRVNATIEQIFHSFKA
jgi:hypothetical protein